MTTLEQLVKRFADNIDWFEIVGIIIQKQIDQLVFDLYDLTEEDSCEPDSVVESIVVLKFRTTIP
jgi:hypothetical protein